MYFYFFLPWYLVHLMPLVSPSRVLSVVSDLLTLVPNFPLPYSPSCVYARRYTRSYVLLLAPSLLCTSIRSIKLIARSAYPIPRFFLFYLQASPLPLLKAPFACADTFSSFILFPHHVCFVTPCSRRNHSPSAPPTFSLPPKLAVCSNVLSCVFGSLLLPLPRDTAHATFLPTLS